VWWSCEMMDGRSCKKIGSDATCTANRASGIVLLPAFRPRNYFFCLWFHCCSCVCPLPLILSTARGTLARAGLAKPTRYSIASQPISIMICEVE
jgi:hypothetical protein